MVRAPCCEKMGMKKGPWTPEEDQVLIDYIQQYGHGNWRALPRHAGLLRCGKSCRLRWTNYLRPDIKRGNFSREEEETIIELHETLGNRWSAIAAKLPGRTDNEIKNVWHTHLKKKAALRKTNNHEEKLESGPQSSIDISSKIDQNIEITNFTNHATSSESTWYVPVSSQQQQQSCSDISISSSSDISSTLDDINMFLFDSYKVESPGDFPEVDESFWSEVLSTEVENFSGGDGSDLPASFEVDPQLQLQLSPLLAMDPVHNACNMHYDDGLDFWLAEGMACFT